MGYTDAVDAPPARGVPERDIWGPARLRAGIARLNARQNIFHVWRSNERRVWASRVTSGQGAVPGKPGLFTGCGEALDADNPDLMEGLLVTAGAIPPGPEWLTCAEVGAAFGVNAKTAAEWDRKGRFGRGDVITTPGGIRRFRAAAVYALRDQMAGAA
jgi:hypothetical protein